MKTIWEELAEFIEETKVAAIMCGITSNEMLAIFIDLKNQEV